MNWAVQIVAAIVYSHIFEYAIHRWILHKFGMRKGSILSFHFYSHHTDARLNKFIDNSYKGIPFFTNAAGKEILGLLFALSLHFPIFYYFPIAGAVMLFSTMQYYYIHRKAHLNPEWAKENLIWHYEHHMSLNQNKNFGIRSDLIDRILGTRKRYL